MTDSTTLCTPDHPQSRLHRFFDRNFLNYTAYVIRERAIP
jgi:DNA gyrase/topoisomerase IV subunit A